MKKNTVRLTEAQLHKVIKESVKRVIREMGENPSRIMDRLNGGTNRAKFRDQDMKKDWEDAEPSHIRNARKRFNSLPNDYQENYKDAYGSKLFQDEDNMWDFTQPEMNSDWEKFGNPNLDDDAVVYPTNPWGEGNFHTNSRLGVGKR